MGLLNLEPRVVAATRSAQMSYLIQERLKSESYDLVIASQWKMAAYHQDFAQYPAIFEEVELGAFQSKKSEADTTMEAFRHLLPLLKMRRYVGNLALKFWASTVVSQQEANLLTEAVPGKSRVELIPNFVDLDQYRDIDSPREEKMLIFAGSMNYAPNHEAMTWFTGDMLPEIRKRVPGSKLLITGDGNHQHLPSEDGVIRTGLVPDIQRLVSSSTVSLVPIRRGGGTRLKVLEAMALGTPIVSTTKGMEGLTVFSDEHALIADGRDEFVEATIRLLEDSSLRRRLAHNARQLVREKYERSVVVPKFLELVESAIS